MVGDQKSTRLKSGITIAAIASFFMASQIFFIWLPKIGVDSNVTAVIGLVAAAFVSYIVLTVFGIVKEFSFKGGPLEFSSKLEEVKNEVKETKREIGDRISYLNQLFTVSMQSISNKISTNVNQEAPDLPGVIREFGKLIGEKRANTISEIGIQTALYPSNKIGISEEDKQKVMDYTRLQNLILEFLHENIPDVGDDMKYANFLFYDGHYDEAKKIYSTIIGHHPDNIQAFVNLGKIYYHEGNYDEALKYYDRALLLDGNTAEAIVYKAFILSRQEKQPEALTLFRKIADMAIDENNIDAVTNKGYALEIIERKDEAIVYYTKAIQMETHEDSFDNLFNKAFALASLAELKNCHDKYDDALALYEKAGKLRPTNYFVPYNRACIYCMQNKLDESLNILEQVFKSAPWMKKAAEDDHQLSNLKNNERFKKLVEQ